MKTQTKLKLAIFSLFICYPIMVGMNSFKFIISPPLVNLKLRPNELKKIDLTVYNQNDKKLSLLIRTCSLEMDKKGNALASDKTNDPFSCATWLKIPVDNITIDPHAKKIVPVEIKVPYGATGGKYGIILFETATQPQTRDEIVLIGRMGTIFMLEVYGAKKIDAAIKGFKIAKENGSIHFTAQIFNSGNTHFKARGSVIIKDNLDKIVDRVKLEVGTGSVLPNHEREFAGVWNNPRKMEKGKYRAILQIFIPGHGRTLQEVKDFIIN